MALMTYAFNHDSKNMWFCFLTDSCVPIISPATFRKLFFDHYQASILKCKPAYRNIQIHRRANLRLFKKEFWLANDPWFTLTRSHIHKCLIFLAAKNGIYNQVNEGGLANESIFAIILQTFKELTNPNTYINQCSSVADWTRMSSPTSPYLFKEGSEQNINIIKDLLKENPYAMFLRKVDRAFPDTVIKELWDAKFDHEYPVLHNQYKVKRDQDGSELSVANVNEKNNNNNNSLITQFLQLRKHCQFGFNLVLLVAIFVFVNLL
jgi:hypothetical protein